MKKEYWKLIDCFFMACNLMRNNSQSMHITMDNSITLYICSAGTNRYQYSIIFGEFKGEIKQESASEAVFRLQLKEILEEINPTREENLLDRY